MGKYLVGIDNGSTMAKAAIFDTLGNELATASRKVEYIYPAPERSEVDMNKLWADTAAVIKEAIEKAKIDPADIACVACTGHGNGVYLVGPDGKPSNHCIRADDSRSRSYIEQWIADGTHDRVLPKITQILWPGQPNSILRWLKDNEPEVIERAQWFFTAKDFCRFMLTGEAYQEISDTSGCSLMDVTTGEYDDEILAAWGIEDLKRIMPPLRQSHDICGHVTAEASAQTGLKEGTPVAGGMFDIDACGLACSMTDETELVMIAGTWGNNQYITREPVVSKNIFMNTCYSIPGYYLVLEGSATSASNFEWLVTEFFQADQELMKAKGDGRSIYAYCTELVEQTKPTDAGIVFLPYLYGSPVSLDAKAAFFGLEGRHQVGHVIRAMFEGIIFGHYWHVERLLPLRDGVMPEHIRLTGGAARSEVWSQMIADIFQTSVEIPHGSELGGLGCAICGAVATGIYASYDEACQSMVKIDRTYSPNPELAGVYRKKYARYKKMLEVLQPVWEEMVWTGE